MLSTGSWKRTYVATAGVVAFVTVKSLSLRPIVHDFFSDGLLGFLSFDKG